MHSISPSLPLRISPKNHDDYTRPASDSREIKHYYILQESSARLQGARWPGCHRIPWAVELSVCVSWKRFLAQSREIHVVAKSEYTSPEESSASGEVWAALPHLQRLWETIEVVASKFMACCNMPLNRLLQPPDTAGDCLWATMTASPLGYQSARVLIQINAAPGKKIPKAWSRQRSIRPPNSTESNALTEAKKQNSNDVSHELAPSSKRNEAFQAIEYSER